MGSLTATNLVSSVRRRASIPSTSATGAADSDLLAYANEELQRRLSAQLMAAREEYGVFDADSAITSATKYRIPARAIGAKLRGVFLLDSSGQPLQRLGKVELERLDEFQGLGSLYGFAVKNNDVILVPNSSTSAVTLRLSFYLRPNDLTTTASDYATVSSVSGNVITTTGAHGFNTATSLDLVKGTSPHECQFISTTPSSTTSNTLTFSSLSGLSIGSGDYVCRAEKSPVPQIPAELHDVLAQRVAIRYLESIGDRVGLSVAVDRLKEMEEDIDVLISPRIDSALPKIVNRYGALGGVPWRYRFTGG